MKKVVLLIGVAYQNLATTTSMKWWGEMGIKKEITGQVFGHWRILHDVEPQHTKRCVAAQCSCGTIRTSYLHNLTSGRSTSCGCQQKVKCSKFMKQYWKDKKGE